MNTHDDNHAFGREPHVCDGELAVLLRSRPSGPETKNRGALFACADTIGEWAPGHPMKRPDDTRREYALRRREAAADKLARAECEARRALSSKRALARYSTKAIAYAEGASSIVDAVFRRAPKLAAEPHATAVRRMAKLTTFRPVAEWGPRGKGRDALFRSLGEHLLAKYRVPPLLWSAFFDAEADKLVPLVAHVASGGSLHALVTSARFAVPLTRRMCHELLTMPSRGSLLHAIRRVEVNAVGGDERLLQAWMGTRAARTLGTRAEEAFWMTVLEWLANAAMVDPSQVAPLVDYIAYRRDRDGKFSVAGRSIVALSRAMNDWHEELARMKIVRGATFEPSGFEAVELDRSMRASDGGVARRIWRVEEVLSTRALAAEGRRMSHCVYSYAWSIEKKQTSIWSMTMEDGRGETGRWAMLTVEVRNESRRIVQARGRYNRPASSEEHAVLMAWAGANGLELSLGKW